MCQENRNRLSLNAENEVAAWYDLPREIRPHPILFVIEEFPSMVTSAPGDSKEEIFMQREIHFLCQKIGREARPGGVHMMLMMQKPDSAALGPKLENSVNARLVLGPADHTTRQKSFLDPDAAPKLEGRVPRGRGVFQQVPKADIVQVFFQQR